MTKECKTKPTDDRPAYEPPRALRLGDMHAGEGIGCSQPGSGALGCGWPGNTPTGGCEDPGNFFQE
jgi:hypothetical protein